VGEERTMTAYILHHNRYWTEYLDFLIEDNNPQFELVASCGATENYDAQHSLSTMPPFDPKKHHTILSPGRLHDPTDRNFIVMRFLHSPGFYAYSMIRAYAELVLRHNTSDYRFLVLEECYRALTLREFNDPAVDHFRYQMMNDPKVQRIKVDTMMYKIRDAQQIEKRTPGTGLLCLTWLLMDNDFFDFVEIVKTLNQELKVDLLLHPLMRLNKNYMKALSTLEGKLIGKIYYNLTRCELVNLYDQYEFVISNGSGSCYEAILRGCKPLSIKELRNTPNDVDINEELEDEYLPFPSYKEIASAPPFDSSAFIKRYFPYLEKYSAEEAKILAKNEVTQAMLF